MSSKLRIITYNVNGIRAAVRKGLADWIQAARPDVLCLQEIKANHDTFPRALFESLGYRCYLYPAQKAGYSGVAILSRLPAKQVVEGMQHPLYDAEGRVLRAFYEGICVVSVYMPSGSSGDERQAVKMQFLEDFNHFVEQHRQQYPEYPLVICGDFNICHQAIDIHNPVRNANTSGFLPEERAWMSDFLERGFIDTFRHFNPEPHHYTWWSYRARAREKNLGWRIDYCMADVQLKEQLQRAVILPEARHSDHCPVLLELSL
ncbi:MAG: exodeoxyribonuclease [Thermonema sp.]|uniref:exodeoxyribonuclease III n=1 Tax=Thermonema sp. TaxID=2231181 RepID=UPI0021DBC04E|nr:exodeoxyribonuclease III [Thermonema sp.]GIV39888.1 MAG: exodeoxyribonuclease [Thermonema sp.]